MSRTVLEHWPLAVTAYAGPLRPNGADRTRYQITNEQTGEYVTLSREQYQDLLACGADHGQDV